MKEERNKKQIYSIDLSTQIGQEEAQGKFLLEPIIGEDQKTLISTEQELNHRLIEQLLKIKGINLSEVVVSDTPIIYTKEADNAPKSENLLNIQENGALIGRNLDILIEQTRQKHEKIKEKVVNIIDLKKQEFKIPPEIEKLLAELIESITDENSLKELTLFNILSEDKEHEETVSHSIGVAIRTTLFGHFLMEKHPEVAKKYELNSIEDLKEIARAGLLHDIGKTLIDKSVLYKAGKLSNGEKDHIDTHADIGGEMLSGLYQRVALEHHNKTSSSNHPYSEIIHIIDVIDALAQKRSYRDAMQPIESMFVQIEDYLDGSYNHELFNLIYQFQFDSTEPILAERLAFKLPFSKTDELKEDFNIKSLATPEEKAKGLEKNICGVVLKTNGYIADCIVVERTQERDQNNEVLLSSRTHTPMLDKDGDVIKLALRFPENLESKSQELKTTLKNITTIYQAKKGQFTQEKREQKLAKAV